MKNYLLPHDEKGVNHALASFFSRLLSDGIVGSLLVPQNSGSGKSVVMTLVKSPEALKDINPFAPLSMANAARIVSDLTTLEDPGEKIGVVLRSCETRALIELAKHNQASLENIVIIGMDCIGTLDQPEFARLISRNPKLAEEWTAGAGREGREEIYGTQIRQACSACSHVESEHASIHLGWVGVENNILVAVSDEYSEWAGTFLGQGSDQAPGARLDLIKTIRGERDANWKKLCEEFSARTGNVESLLEEFSGCIKCHNCRQVCPMCFCRECVFSTELFKHDPEYYLSRAGRKGLTGMPSERMLFHLTRINHMALGCVGCGQCQSACPGKIPLGIIFRMAGERMQEVFDYVPGRSLEEEPPLTTYKESELEPR